MNVRTAFFLSFLVAVTGSSFSQRNPVPFVNQPLVPMTAVPGGSGFTLTVNGTGFVPGSVVAWNRSRLVTTFVTSSQLTALVPASDISVAQTASVTVVSPAPGGGVSNIEFFDISAPAENVTFTALTAYSSQSFLLSALSSDFNNDGKLDLAYVSRDANNNLLIQLGNGDGSFQSPATYSPGTFLASMVTGDFNGDGNPDLGVIDDDSGAVSILLGKGDGTFQFLQDFVTGSSPSNNFADHNGLVSADLNGDGNLDLVVALGTNTSGISVLLGNGDGTFQPPLISDTSEYATPIQVGDFNRDGKLDLIYSIPNGMNYLQMNFRQGNGDGTFQAPIAILDWLVPGSSDLAAADIAGTGKLDVLASNFYGLWVLRGSGDGTFQPGVDYDPGSVAFSLLLQDFNADGSLDTALANADNNSLSILSGNGDGTFHSPAKFAVIPGPYSFAAGDFNGDGKMDLAVTTGFDNSTVVILIQGQLPMANLQPSSLIFDEQSIGTTSSPRAVTLSNTGNEPLAISDIELTGKDAVGFTQTNNCPARLAASSSCQIMVTFTPLAPVNALAFLSVTDNSPGSPHTVSLTGTTPPAPIVILKPSSITFPNQYVGTSGLPQTVTITNTGNGALTITNVAASPGDFGTLNACGTTIEAGSSCPIGVFFDPTATGTRSGTLTVTDSAGDSPQIVTLNGTGQDFSITSAGATSATVSPGQTANYSITIAPGGGFNQAVAFTCTGAPPQSTCSLSPSSVILSGTSNSSVNVTVTTTGSVARLAYPTNLFLGSGNAFGLCLTICGLPSLALIGIWGRQPRRRKQHKALLFLLSLCTLPIAFHMFGCGGSSHNDSGGNGGTPAGTYKLSVTGSFTSGKATLTHTAKLTLVVQ